MMVLPAACFQYIFSKSRLPCPCYFSSMTYCQYFFTDFSQLMKPRVLSAKRSQEMNAELSLDALSPFERLPIELVWSIFICNHLYHLRNLRLVSCIFLNFLDNCNIDFKKKQKNSRLSQASQTMNFIVSSYENDKKSPIERLPIPLTMRILEYVLRTKTYIKQKPIFNLRLVRICS